MKTFFVVYTKIENGNMIIVNAHTSEYNMDSLEGIQGFKENRERNGESNIVILFFKEVKGWYQN